MRQELQVASAPDCLLLLLLLLHHTGLGPASQGSTAYHKGFSTFFDFVACMPDELTSVVYTCRHYAEASRQGRISARRRSPQVPLDAPSDEGLKRVFRNYCRLPIGQGRQVGGSVQQLNAAQFNQLCRDASLVEPAGE